MTQAGLCRLWNFSLASVFVLTLLNILLTVRLLHNSNCGRQIQINPDISLSQTYARKQSVVIPPSTPTRPIPKAEKYELLEKLPDIPPCVDSYDQKQFYNQTEEIVFAFSSINLNLARWDSTRSYKMFDFAVIGEQYVALSEKYTVTLATQSSLDRMSTLTEVAYKWTGPISMAVFAAGEEFPLLRLYVTYLRKCFPFIRSRVSFHLATPVVKPAVESLPSSDTLELESMDCGQPKIMLEMLLRLRSPETVKWRLKNPYPQNHLRNLARKNCQSKFIFLIDADIIVSDGLANSLDKFLRSANCNKCAYVVPTYELDERVQFPKNKSDLVRLAYRGLARPFHQKVFIYNQFATNFTRWQKNMSEVSTYISHNVTNFEFLYEPFYVATDTVPPHDERFVGYGYTRNSQFSHRGYYVHFEYPYPANRRRDCTILSYEEANTAGHLDMYYIRYNSTDIWSDSDSSSWPAPLIDGQCVSSAAYNATFIDNLFTLRNINYYILGTDYDNWLVAYLCLQTSATTKDEYLYVASPARNVTVSGAYEAAARALITAKGFDQSILVPTNHATICPKTW